MTRLLPAASLQLCLCSSRRGSGAAAFAIGGL